MKMLFNGLAAICAFGAAWFWYKSSFDMPPPPVGAFAEQVMPALKIYQAAVQRAARSNRWAALLSAISALFTGLSLAIPS